MTNFKSHYLSLSIIAILVCTIKPHLFSETFSPSENTEPTIKYNQRLWNEMRRRVEYGDRYEAQLKPSTAAPVSVQQTPTEPPPGLAVELPYESAISISGRKLIAVDLKMTQYLNPEEARAKNITPSRTDINMTQELQVRIKGRVGRKINVNIDFDDTTADKRDISVVYKGDPDEVVQEAAFGDITMSLPQTEFVGYSRQLFGAKVDAKYENMRFIGFGSKTKGQSQIKRFTGNTALERKEINDTAYIRYKYYRLAFGQDSIKRGTEKIWLDDKNPANNNINTSSMTVETLSSGTTTFGNFDLLIPGQDYSVDYEKGVIYFRKTILSNYVIAVDYQRSDGTYLKDTGLYGGMPKIIKDESNIITTELKNYYSIGRTRILRDDGRGNFILKIQDLNRNDVSAIGDKPAPKYPDDIEVDFEQGFFYFKSTTTPFLPDAYKNSPTSSYRIFVEYRYRFKTFQLTPGIVPQSERVVLDGKTLSRDADYLIDYDAGFITFYNEEKINADSVIEISYDYAPFGSMAGGSTIIGLRGEIALTPNLFIGSSYLSEFAASAQTLPDIKNPPSSLSVWEVDTRATNINLPLLGWNLSVGGEMAQSVRDPNTRNKAIIESMEGIKQEDRVSLFKDSWKYSASTFKYPYQSAISWFNEEIYLREMNPAVDETVTEKRQILTINYDTVNSTSCAIIQPLSKIGMDFSKKLYLETWIYGDNSGSKLDFYVGILNEDIDGDGILDTEDKNGDGILNQGEDTGIVLTNPDGTTSIIGAGNGILDTEDLDGNGYLNTIDMPVPPSPYSITINWSGWKFIRIPLSITSADQSKWEIIKQVRLEISGNKSGTIKIGDISFVGQRWETVFASPGSTITISAVNNEEDVNYVSLVNDPAYQDLYDIKDTTQKYKKEQALAIKYELSSGSVATRLLYSRPYDFSQYRKLKFFLYGDGSGEEFFIQAGNDSNYFEFKIPITWNKQWRVITINQVDKNKDGKPDVWETSEAGGETAIVGSPNLNNISQLKVGIRSKSSGVSSGEIWLNEIYVEDTYKKEGLAYRYNADLTVPDWANLGGKRKEVNRNFETFTGGIENQDRLEESAYFNMPQIWLLKPWFLNWIKMPLNTSFSKNITVTPSAIETKEGLVSVLEEGKVINLAATADTSITIKYLPNVSARYSRSITDTQQIKRLEDKEITSLSASYAPPRFVFFPTSLSGGYSVGYSYFRPWQEVSKYEEYLDIKDYLSLEESRSWNASAPFQFWSLLSINPAFSQGEVTEEKKDLFLRDGISQKYPKSFNQTASLNGSLRLANFFQPGFSYNLTLNENYNLTYSTPLTFPSETKAIIRSGAAEVNWNLNIRDLTSFAHTRSLAFNSSYRIADGDSYDNVPSSFSVREKFWIRDKIPEILDKRKTLTQSDTVRLSGRWNPLQEMYLPGRISAFKTLSANITYSRSDEFSDTTGTERKSFTLNWPDMLFTLGEAEKIFFIERYATDTNLTYRNALRHTETIGQNSSENSNFGIELRTLAFRKYDLSGNYSESSTEELDLRTGALTLRTKLSKSNASGIQIGFNLGKWRLTARYDESNQYTWDGFNKLTSDSETKTPSLSAYWDYISPGGIKLPLIGQTLPLTNRFTFNTNLNLTQNRSSVNYERGNTDSYNFSFTGDYEASANFRVAVGGGFNYYKNLTLSYEDYYSININSRLTIQF